MPRSASTSRARSEEIELLLRSTPPGAAAAIDGQPVGVTPILWRGPSGQKPREFTFVLAGYGMARYRFIPTKSGIVHGTLKRLPTHVHDAGAAPESAPAP